MAVNTTAKKSDYISNVAAQARAINEANDALIALARQYANEYGGGQSLALVDADFVGTNSYMAAAQFATFFSAVQPAVAAAISGQYQSLLAVIA